MENQSAVLGTTLRNVCNPHHLNQFAIYERHRLESIKTSDQLSHGSAKLPSTAIIQRYTSSGNVIALAGGCQKIPEKVSPWNLRLLGRAFSRLNFQLECATAGEKVSLPIPERLSFGF
jgi:hypothetical protein